MVVVVSVGAVVTLVVASQGAVDAYASDTACNAMRKPLD